ncbi:MAG: hypothetical protein PHG04_00540 [Candidatus Nanoarchaeia archaeon]|nr:hypothetical protein [Candidatus Nanoarchaeia archaeon]MDD5053852.1 hypothetical protein [Candidatus Nanoarchaeia archaeon]
MKKDAYYLLFLVIITIFFYNSIVFKFDEILDSPDVYDLSYPWLSFFNEYFLKSQIPLWNPYNFFGDSFVGNPQTSMFYMFNFIFSQVFNEKYIFTFGIIFHTLLSGISMYYLCKTFKLNSKSSFVSAILFMFNSFMVNRVGHYMLFCAMSYFPLIFLIFKKSLDEKSKYFSFLTGFFLGIVLLISVTQIFLYLMMALFAFWLFNFVAKKEYGSKSRILNYAVLMLIPVFFSVFISGAQFFPSLELSSHTLRSHMTYEYASTYSMSIEKYINIFSPNFFGNGKDMPFWLKGLSAVETAPYIGIFALFLAIFAIKFKNNNKNVLFFSLLLLLSFVFSFVNPFLFNLPFFGSFRAYARILIVSNFSISILAGFGFDFFLGKSFKKNKESICKTIKHFSFFIILFFALSSIIVLFRVYEQFNSMNINIEQDSSAISKISYDNKSFSIKDSLIFSLKDFFYFVLFYAGSIAIIFLKIKNKSKHVPLMAISFIIFNLFFFNYGGIKTAPLDSLESSNNFNEINSYKENLGLYRYFDTLDQGNSNMLDKYFNIRGNNPSRFYDSELFFSNNYDYGAYFNITTDYNDNLTYEKYDLMGVKYIFSDILIHDSSLELINETDKHFVYENTDVLPRAFLLSKEENCSKTFNSSLNYLIKEGCSLNLSNYCLQEANISNYSIHGVVLSLNAGIKGFVVLTDAYYAGWKASIDGIEAPIMKYSNIFRAVEVDENSKEIIFSYEPESFKFGSLLSVSSLIFFAIMSFFKIIGVYEKKLLIK